MIWVCGVIRRNKAILSGIFVGCSQRHYTEADRARTISGSQISSGSHPLLSLSSASTSRMVCSSLCSIGTK